MTRKEAIELLKEYASRIKPFYEPYRTEYPQAIDMAIKALSAEDRPTGEWIEVDCYESEKHSVTDMRCSLCGKYASMVLPHRTRCVYDFCPNCGAKMGGDSDG